MSGLAAGLAPAEPVVAPSADPAPDPVPAPPSESAPAPNGAPQSENWRTQWVKDEAMAKRLDRFTDPESFVKSYLEMEKRWSDGNTIKMPGKDATPEEVSAFHRKLGVPESPDKYEIKLPEGAVLDDAAREVLTKATARFHQLGAPPAIVQAAHEMYIEAQAEDAKAFAAHAQELTDVGIAELQKEWGDQGFKENLEFGNAVLAKFVPDDAARDELLNTMMFDGRKLATHPAVIRLLAAVGRQVSQTDELFLKTTQASVRGIEAINQRIAEIEGMRTGTYDQRRDYNKHVDELGLLIQQRDQMRQTR